MIRMHIIYFLRNYLTNLQPYDRRQIEAKYNKDGIVRTPPKIPNQPVLFSQILMARFNNSLENTMLAALYFTNYTLPRSLSKKEKLSQHILMPTSVKKNDNMMTYVSVFSSIKCPMGMRHDDIPSSSSGLVAAHVCSADDLPSERQPC